jgi:hypothetical protein
MTFRSSSPLPVGEVARSAGEGIAHALRFSAALPPAPLTPALSPRERGKNEAPEPSCIHHYPFVSANGPSIVNTQPSTRFGARGHSAIRICCCTSNAACAACTPETCGGDCSRFSRAFSDIAAVSRYEDPDAITFQVNSARKHVRTFLSVVVHPAHPPFAGTRPPLVPSACLACN